MKTMKAKLTAGAFVAAIVAATIFAAAVAPLSMRVAADTSVWTPNAGWSTTVEDGVTVYNRTGGDLETIDYYEDYGNYEYFSMDANFNGADPSNANVGLYIYHDSGNYWLIDATTEKNVRIRYYYPNEVWAVYDAYTLDSTSDWFNFRVEFEGETMRAFINGEQIVSYTNNDTNVQTMSRVHLKVMSWGVASTVKNLTVGKKNYSVNGGWTKSDEGGDTVYTNDGGYSTIDRITDAGAYNTFSADVRTNNIAADLFDGNVSLNIKLNSTDRYMFEYNPAPSRRYARLRYFDAAHSGEGIELRKVDIDIAPANEFIELKAVFERDYLSFYVGGERVIAHFDTGDNDFSTAQAALSAWNIAASVKNLAVSNTEKDYEGVSYVDLEFDKELSARVFDATGGDIGWLESGALDLTVTGGDPVITSPVIDVPEGSAYSMKLSVRNTFAVRLKNNTAANKLKLSYVTAVDGTYDEKKQKTFDIIPDSDYNTYYFNISDVADCGHWQSNSALRACNCFLRGFKFEFIGATGGDMEIDAITFEREDRIYQKAATSLACAADKTEKTVTVSGSVLEKYAGKTISIYETSVKNYNELLSYAGNKKIADGAVADDGSFEITFPLVRENGVSHLSTIFLAAVDGDKLDDAFMIENWRDFSENPYAFDLPDLTVSVTEARFGAKGDGFTNDNGAIQAAIDYVSAQGGGAVVIPGGDDPYGRRYIATQLTLKDNVELRIEKGAALWQSQRFEDYDYGDYEPVYGHDVVIPGVPWTHAAVSWNLPFIYANEVHNVRVTGGGEVRMQDTGSQWLDGNGYGWDSDIAVNCESVIHIHPFGVHKSTNVEISDITVKRSNIWHMPIINSSNIYCGNIALTEVSCINGDGITFGVGTHNAVIDRCTLYSNDDAVVLSAFHDDPRGYDRAWWRSHPDDFSGVSDITVTHSNMYGGHGITFITWGSDSPQADNEEIKNIRVVDNVLGGTSTAVGCWTDNPYYGESYMNTYDQLEKNDYSPIRDLYIVGNIYTDPTLLGTWDGETPELALATNAVTDCGILSPSQFVNGAFDKTLRYASEQTWRTGLSYWSYSTDEGGEVGVEKQGTKQTTVVGSSEKLTIDDYAAYVKGNGELYQGLYLPFGAYEFDLKIKLVAGSAKLFARNAVTGDVIAQKDMTAGETFDPMKLAFSVTSGTTVQLGIIHEGESGEAVYIDDAEVVASFDADMFEVEGVQRTWMFDTEMGFVQYDPDNTPLRVSGGALVTDNRSEYKIMLDQTGALTEFDVRTDILVPNGIAVNAGLYLLATDVRYAKDKISAYNVQAEYAAGDDEYIIRLYRFSATDGYVGKLTESKSIPLVGDKISLRAVVKHNTLFVFADGAEEYAFAYELPHDYEGGNVGLRSQFRSTRFDSFSLTSSQVREAAGIKTELNATLSVAKKFVEYAYTEASFAALKSAIAQAEALSSDATQTQIDAAKAKLDEAIAGLQAAPQKTPDNPDNPDDPDTPVTPETPDPIIKTVTVKDTGMTIGFYILLGLLIAGIAAATVVNVKSKRGGKKE